ncbi:putative HTH-type transcriptional regulator [Acrocarpospora phusangensis]|uniref:HTH-type transcriptional regulator n=1 Tax=Acrocarpospora phusangensis TaxID=1070424 RepID=A0A919QEX9_9ACTN|nr:GntR family transcriptional regulator [Acrocarpospora phusangensis]GIH27929.1 putative HTH-type transcriptional regulator [Acrocarpospora phusangensis]
MAIGYRELAEVLREAIRREDYTAGETLPKQEEIAEQYGVNIKTVRQAVRLLESEGLVTPVRRRGTVVRARPPMKRLGVERYAKSKWKFGLVAFAADREASGRAWSPTDQTQTVRLVEADAEVAEAFGLSIGAQVYERARLVKEGDSPTHTLTSYYRPEDVQDTPLADPTPGPAGRGGGFAVLTLQGLEPDSMTETIHARMPTPDEAELLALPAGEPVMILQRRTFTREGRLVEFARGIHAASRFSWSYTFKIPD